MKVRVNLNQKTTVRLCRRGLEALKGYHRGTTVLDPKKYKEGDLFTARLWEIMHIFGGFTYMGPEPPFDTEIKIDIEGL